MKVACRKENGIGLISISGSLTAATAEPFREELDAWQAVEEEVKSFIFDLSDVDFMDSAGLGALIAALKRITEDAGDLKLACLQKKPRMVFKITRAYKLFEIFDTVEEAFAAASE